MKIIFEDEDFLVCGKPQGVPCESAAPGTECAADLLRSENGISGELFTVHRLDTNTGGVMIFAKNKKAAAFLSARITSGDFKKRYLALLDGVPAEKSGVYRDLLFKDSRKNRSFVVDRVRKGVKEASLEYETLAVSEDTGKSLVRVLLHTGRTHQIRVQFSSRKTPLCGDGKYGSRDNKAELSLWACSLSFTDEKGNIREFTSLPDTGKYPWSLFSEEIE